MSFKKIGRLRVLLILLLAGFFAAAGCSKEAEKTPVKKAEYKSELSSGGAGEKVWINRWAFARPMQVKRAGVAGVVVGKRIYAIGGGEFSRKGLEIFDTVEYADVMPDGELGPWKFSGPLTMPRVYPVAVIYGDYIYVMGGETLDEIFTGAEEQKAPKLLKTVERAKINADGTLGEWTLEKGKMHFPRRGGEVYAVNGWLYAGGGFGGDFLNDVEKAPINPDGSLGEWTEASFFNNDRYISGFASMGNRLYVMGGHINSPERAMDSVETAVAGPDGTLTEWTETSPLYTRRFLNTALVTGDTIYTFAGHNTINLASVEKAKIQGEGKLGKWEPDTSLNVPRRAASSVIVGNRIYVIGGMVKPMGTSDSVNIVETAVIEDGKQLGNYVPAGSDAHKEYESLKDSIPADAINHISHGKAYFKRKAYKSVLYDAQEALKEYPNLPEAYNLMADTHYAMGDKDKAFKALEKSLEIKENFYALVGLAFMVFDKGEFGEAARLYKRAIVIDPESVTAHFNLGNAYINSGAYELAAKEFKWVLAKDPNIKEAEHLLDRSLKHVGAKGRKLE